MPTVEINSVCVRAAPLRPKPRRRTPALPRRRRRTARLPRACTTTHPRRRKPNFGAFAKWARGCAERTGWSLRLNQKIPRGRPTISRKHSLGRPDRVGRRSPNPCRPFFRVQRWIPRLEPSTPPARPGGSRQGPLPSYGAAQKGKLMPRRARRFRSAKLLERTLFPAPVHNSTLRRPGAQPVIDAREEELQRASRIVYVRTSHHGGRSRPAKSRPPPPPPPPPPPARRVPRVLEHAINTITPVLRGCATPGRVRRRETNKDPSRCRPAPRARHPPSRSLGFRHGSVLHLPPRKNRPRRVHMSEKLCRRILDDRPLNSAGNAFKRKDPTRSTRMRRPTRLSLNYQPITAW